MQFLWIIWKWKKKGQNIFWLPEWVIEPQIFSNFPTHDLNFHRKWLILLTLLKNWVAEGVASKVNDTIPERVFETQNSSHFPTHDLNFHGKWGRWDQILARKLKFLDFIL